jgi:uncharacterized protein (UPF0276 family)
MGMRGRADDERYGSIRKNENAERVAQIHIAGHTEFQRYTLDTHDHPVIEPVWQLYKRAIDRCGPTATLLEWDDNIPSFDEVHREALKANQFLHTKEELLPSVPGATKPILEEAIR